MYTLVHLSLAPVFSHKQRSDTPAAQVEKYIFTDVARGGKREREKAREGTSETRKNCARKTIYAKRVSERAEYSTHTRVNLIPPERVCRYVY